MANPTITGSGPNSRTNLQNIHSGQRSFQKDLATTHSQIKLMQSALTTQGYDTKGADGKFGDNTLPAVKAFQRAKGLTADGYFGKNSLLALETALGRHLDPSSGGCLAGGGGDDGASSYPTGSFGETTKPGVRLRNKPGGSNSRQVVQGSMFYIEGTENGPTISGSSSTLWVKVRFGKGDGTYESRYVHSSCFGNVKTLADSVKTRMVEIAKSLENNTGSGLGLAGEWCQLFIYWLIGACGIDGLKVPTSGYCGTARSTWVEKYGAAWHERGDNHVPSDGDLIYYGDLGSSESTHVGIVIDGGNSFSTIEGNMGTNTNQSNNKVKLCTGSVSSGKCNNKYYQGFLELEY